MPHASNAFLELIRPQGAPRGGWGRSHNPLPLQEEVEMASKVSVLWSITVGKKTSHRYWVGSGLSVYVLVLTFPTWMDLKILWWHSDFSFVFSPSGTFSGTKESKRSLENLAPFDHFPCIVRRRKLPISRGLVVVLRSFGNTAEENNPVACGNP